MKPLASEPRSWPNIPLKFTPPRLSGWLAGLCTTQDRQKTSSAKSRELLGQAQWGEFQQAAYAEKHGFENLCRVLFNVSEFVFVD